MRNKQIEVIQVLYQYVLDSCIFKTHGHRFEKQIKGETLGFHRCVSLIVDRIQSLESDNDEWLSIGENSECALSDFVVACYWACVDCHGGQESPTYALQCKLGEIFTPGMSTLDSENDTVRDTCYLICTFLTTGERTMKPQIQKVVFRRFSKKEGGQVIALLCNTGRDCLPGNVMSYMRHGQHSEAGRYLGEHLRLASPEEYAPLLTELRRIYAPEFEIVPVSRLTV